jgi:hypothetical protein
MGFFDAILNFFKSLGVNIGAFFAGKYAEKYESNKNDLNIEKERDKIDARAASSRADIIKRMRDNRF